MHKHWGSFLTHCMSSVCLSVTICVYMCHTSVPVSVPHISPNFTSNYEFNPQPHFRHCQTHTFTAKLVNMAKGCKGHSRIQGSFWHGRWQCHFTLWSNPTSIMAEARQVCLWYHLPPCQYWQMTCYCTGLTWFRSLASVESRIWKECCIKPS